MAVGFGLLGVRPQAPARVAPADPAQGSRPTLAPGMVAVPVRIADAGSVRLLHPGDHVDVYVTGGERTDVFGGGGGMSGRAVARSVPVLAVPREAMAAGGEQGALLVLQAIRDQAGALAAVPAGARFSIVILGAE